MPPETDDFDPLRTFVGLPFLELERTIYGTSIERGGLYASA
jgi:hypothetical protein